MEKTTVITVGLVVTVFLFLMLLILIALFVFRGESAESYRLRMGWTKSG